MVKDRWLNVVPLVLVKQITPLWRRVVDLSVSRRAERESVVIMNLQRIIIFASKSFKREGKANEYFH